MAEMAPEQAPPPQQDPGGGGILRQRYLGIPGVVWLAGAAFLAYFLFFRNKGSSGGGTSSSGNGQSTTGDISLTPGTTTIDLTGQTSPINTPEGGVSVDQDNSGLNPGGPGVTGTPNPQPSPNPTPKTVTHHTSVTFSRYVVQKGENLLSIAKKFGISRASLAHANNLGTGAGLRTGQVLKVPHVRTLTS